MDQGKFNLQSFLKYLGKLNCKNIRIVNNLINISILYNYLVKNYLIRIKINVLKLLKE